MNTILKSKKTLLYAFTTILITVVALFTMGITASAATEYNINEGSVTITEDGDYIISGTGEATTNTITVESGISANITLNGVNIDVSATENACAFKIADNSTGNVTITLADGTTNTLISGLYRAGLQKNGEYSDTLGTLTIQSDDEGTGVLNAAGGIYGAGIGGACNEATSKITIHSGIINATGGTGGAGIGGGSGGTGCSDIKINGGTVTAEGGEGGGSGIGGGSSGSASGIIINGGNVTAKGGSWGSGIGSEYEGQSSDVTINGGTVTVTAGAPGESIKDTDGLSVSDAIIVDTTAATATVYGDPVITDDFTLPEGYTLVIPESSTVAVAEGVTFTINGTVTNNGTISGLGTIDNNGTISGEVGCTVISCDFVVTGGVLGTDYTYKNGVLTVLTDTEITIKNKDTSMATTNTIVVASGVNADITLNGVNIDVSGTENACAFKIADNSTGNVTITLADGTTNVLKSGSYCAGLQKNGNVEGTLTIQSETAGTGVLEATGGYYGAGIGGGSNGVGQYITIISGKVSAIGGEKGAGIGGGSDGAGYDITINGGTVNATGGYTAAGIGGGGSYAYGSGIIINEGTVNASGGEKGAGIGGGCFGKGINITINGGTVSATGGKKAAGIGGGQEGDGWGITINGGTVTAKGGEDGAGIGGGNCHPGGNIKISDGKVSATGGKYAAGIGGGYEGNGSGIAISGGTVTATGGLRGAGIGGGYGGEASDITISGGSVKASNIGCTPTNGTENVYLLEIENASGRNILINGTDYPDKHFDEAKIYAYLPAKTVQSPNEVDIGEETTKYCYDTTNSKWLTVVEAPEADDTEFTYDGTEKTYAITENAGYTISGNVQTNAGTYTVTVALNDGYIWSDGTTDVKQYTFVINKAVPILEAPTATAITYGEALSNSTLTTSWTWVDGTVIPTVANNGFEAYIEVDDSNYDYTGVDGYDETVHTVTRTIAVTVNRAELTVTAESHTVKLGNPLPETLEYTVTGLMGSDTVDSIGADITIGYENGVTPSALGEYAIVVSGETETTNYAINYVNGKLTITEKEIQTISSADNATLTYGETDGNVTATTDGNGTISYTVTTGEDVISVDENGNITILKFGTATITVKAAETFDYAEATKTISVTVNKKKIAVPTADTTEYTYTGLPQNYGVVSTIDYTVTGGTQTSAGEHPVTITLNNENYEWDGTLGTYTFIIKQVPVTVTANSYTIKAGETLPTYAYDVTGLVNGEALPIDVTISCNAANSNTAGTYTITVSGAANSTNYTFAYVNGTLTVSEKEVVAAPIFTPVSGTTFTSTQNVTIGCATDGASIYYTTDGTEPTTASTLYSGEFTVTATTTIKAIAVKDGMTDSAVVTATYTKKSTGGGGYTPSYPSYPVNPPTPVIPDDDDNNDDTVITDPEDTEESGETNEAESNDTTAPQIKGDNGKIGWDAILDELDDADEGDTVVVDMNGATEVPEKILEQIAGQDIDLVIELDNGFTWTINGEDITDPKTVDMGVSKGSDIPVKVINNVTGESYYITISLAHNGEFGFTAVLTVEMGDENAGYYANLYYYNGEDTEFICADKISSKGKADLTFTHASEYIIVVDDYDHGTAEDVSSAAGTTEETDEIPFETDENPETGIAVCFAGVLVSAAAVAAARKRKKQ